MDYEKKYNEALERARADIDIAADKDLVKGVATTIFPELRESEDERIRKEIIELLKEVGRDDTGISENAKCMIAWLEKQKETHYTKRNALFDKCVAECDPEIMQRVSDEIDEMLEKEQKPNSTEEMPYITDEHFYEREPFDSFKYKLAEYMTKNCTKKEGPYGYEYGISAETILKMAEEELLKRGVVQKPAEWSEEDEHRREGVVEWLRDHQKTIDRNSNNQAYESIESLISWLKSLRPQPKRDGGDDYNKGYINGRAVALKESWKPSKEQMEALEECGECKRCIKELYEQLKKL